MTCKSCFVVVKQAERHICKGRTTEGAFYFNRDKSKRPPKPFNQPLRVCTTETMCVVIQKLCHEFVQQCCSDFEGTHCLQHVA